LAQVEGKDMGTGDIIFLTIVAVFVVGGVAVYLSPRERGGRSRHGNNETTNLFDGGADGGDD
jgi:predicted phage tail protein